MMSTSEHGFFEGYDKDTRYFYAKVFFRLELNLKAYDLGYFNVLLANSDRKTDWLRFEASIPAIVKYLKARESDGY